MENHDSTKCQCTELWKAIKLSPHIVPYKTMVNQPQRKIRLTSNSSKPSWFMLRRKRTSDKYGLRARSSAAFVCLWRAEKKEVPCCKLFETDKVTGWSCSLYWVCWLSICTLPELPPPGWLLLSTVVRAGSWAGSTCVTPHIHFSLFYIQIPLWKLCPDAFVKPLQNYYQIIMTLFHFSDFIVEINLTNEGRYKPFWIPTWVNSVVLAVKLLFQWFS